MNSNNSNSNNSNSKNQNSPENSNLSIQNNQNNQIDLTNKINPPNIDNFSGKKNKRNKNKNKNKIQLNQQIKEEYDNYLESINSDKIANKDNLFPNENSTNDLINLGTNITQNKPSSPKKNFYKNYDSKSLNNLKIKEMKNSIRKNSSYNIIGDIILEINKSGCPSVDGNLVRVGENYSNNQINPVKTIKSSHSLSNLITYSKQGNINNFEMLSDNRFSYLIGDEEIDKENNSNDSLKKNNRDDGIKNQKSNKKNKKSNSIHSDLAERSNIKFEDIKDLDLRINDTVDYHLINTPFKMIGEEMLNDEINNKYKPKAKSSPENQQIIRRLKEVFKKLVNRELKDKPNISQILLDNEISDEVKIKILRKYIKFNTEDEVFSEEADKIKIEIKNLLKQKKLRTTDDYEELGLMVEKKIIPDILKNKLEDIYYRVIGGDQPKLHNLLNNILKLPWERKFNIFDEMSKIGIMHENKVEFIKSLYKKLDADLYGLEETKDSIMSWICQKINNPNRPSTKYLCLCGPAGVGKTSIVHSISESLGMPYSYISLANIDEPGSLIGHGYTYEGSQYGSIADSIIKNGCTNGILLFDELDKAKEKVQNTLLGIFDPLQNSKFRDAYFGEFYLNLSESMMIICLNNLDQVNPILKDRLHIVHISGYTNKEKKIIIDKYIIPKLETQYNIKINIDENIVNKIIEINEEQKGIRQIQMYFVKIYELMILDKYTGKYNFNNVFTIKNLDLLKINQIEKTYLSMYS
jgi:ATP-dependent Lon protease